MLRSSFFATGLFVLLCGVMFLFVDKIVLSSQEDPSRTPGIRGMFMSVNGNRQEVVDPPDWAAFSLMSVGAVTILYSIALPRKKS
jgi:hypothetical protein